MSVTPDGKRAVSGSRDKTVRVWDLASGKCMGIFVTASEVLAVDSYSNLIVAGTTTGEVLFIDLKNLIHGCPFITATRLWLFDNQSWDANLTALCPICGGRFIVKDEWIGKDIDCPMPGCGKQLRLNPLS